MDFLDQNPHVVEQWGGSVPGGVTPREPACGSRDRSRVKE